MPWNEDAAAWTILSRAPGFGTAAAPAIERHGGPRGLLERIGDGRAGECLPPAALHYLRGAGAALRGTERAWLEHPDHHIVSCADARYPARLRQASGHPLVLYVAGDAAALAAPQLAVVGSRNPTAHGRETARRFSRCLAASGLVISSGLAAGIDAESHRGALAAGGRTLAVLGSGIDVTYPRGHAALAREIESCGALVSAFPLGTPPRRQHFPRRNAALAALSLATLVVEAAAGSGSLITARLARRAGRAVFAVPGSIANPLARGCHQLIREGAFLTESPYEICRALAAARSFCGTAACGAAPGKAGISPAGMDKDHKILLDALGFDPVDLDLLVDRTGLEPEAVSSIMLILELEGHVQAAPGGRYSRVPGAGGER